MKNRFQIKKDVEKNKNVWKTLAYTAGGVLAVAAFPGIAAGIATGAAGYVVGNAISKRFSKKSVQGEEEEVSAASSCNNDTINLDDTFDEFKEQLSAYKNNELSRGDYGKLLLALAAVGIATANVDDRISDRERLQIQDFFEVIEKSPIPRNMKQKITGLLDAPPTIREAFQYAQDVPNCDPNIFRNMIIIVGNCDEDFSEKERDLLKTWDCLNLN